MRTSPWCTSGADRATRLPSEIGLASREASRGAISRGTSTWIGGRAANTSSIGCGPSPSGAAAPLPLSHRAPEEERHGRAGLRPLLRRGAGARDRAALGPLLRHHGGDAVGGGRRRCRRGLARRRLHGDGVVAGDDAAPVSRYRSHVGAGGAGARGPAAPPRRVRRRHHLLGPDRLRHHLRHARARRVARASRSGHERRAGRGAGPAAPGPEAEGRHRGPSRAPHPSTARLGLRRVSVLHVPAGGAVRHGQRGARPQGGADRARSGDRRVGSARPSRRRRPRQDGARRSTRSTLAPTRTSSWPTSTPRS